jgi:phospholipid transport system substrate-binding protein
MKKAFYSTLLTGLLVCTGLVFSAHTYAASDPVVMLQSIADQMIHGLEANKASLKGNPGYVYSLARQVVVPHANLDEMSKRVLPPKIWNQATSTQRSQFEKEFTTLLVRTYGSALADYTDQTIRIFPVRGGIGNKTSIKVDSQIIRSNGPAIPISYRVLLNGSQWQVYDMTVEGVSLLESFRSQFADKLMQGNIDSLIKELAAHNAGNEARDHR